MDDQYDCVTEPGLLYDGAVITILESHMLLLQYALRHSLTAKAFSELLTLVSAHLPPGAKAPRSLYMLKQFFVKQFPEVLGSSKVHRYCSVCHRLVQTEVCTNGCNAASCKEFLMVPLANQVKRILQGMQICHNCFVIQLLTFLQ